MLGVLLLAVPVAAQSNTIVIEVDGIVRGDPGEIFQVAFVNVDPGMVGWLCTGTAQTENNASAHPNNDFILASGGASAEIPNWEAASGEIVSLSGTLVLGESITVDLRLGDDGVSSGGVTIILTCAPPAPPETTTTTAPPPPTTAPPPPTTTPTTTPTDTTEPPPEGGVSAGGGATSGRSGEAAMLWVGGGALALLGGATVLAMRRTAGRE
jgi:hypothetical protein